jgi:Bacterial regulatory proteins, gntR family
MAGKARRWGTLDVILFKLGLAFLVFGLFGTINATVGLVQQIGVQQGIDAHRGVATATVVSRNVVEKNPATRFAGDTYTVSYEYRSRWQATLDLPRAAAVGDQVCVEFDITAPQHARPCGTRTDPGNVIVYGIMLLAGAGAWLVLWYRRVRRRAATRSAPPGNGPGARWPIPPEEPGPARPRWLDEVTLADAIRQDIADGTWPVGVLLPDAMDLSDRYGAAIPTVEEALAALRHEGLVRWRLAADGSTFHRAVVALPALEPVSAKLPVDR